MTLACLFVCVCVCVRVCVCVCRHGSVLEEGNAELSQVQETLAVMEAALEEKDRELAIAQEKVQTLTDDLVASQGTVGDSWL